ncbi:MAG TPA: DUF6600 domain-containing protein [Polyangiaceae bacterium]|nr:DUF6600 domain-containing protein [Polyangiaceae bacterium]
MRARVLIVVAFVAAQLNAATSRAQSTADPEQPVDTPVGDDYADTDPSALSEFRGALDPYGTWVEDPTYGTTWVPNSDQVDPSFQPYETAGSWSYVAGDYVWVSDYAWGWVCFHYGRWAFRAGRWLWIPGRDYAGAWVSWRVGDEDFRYVAWAPLAPAWVWMGGVPSAIGLMPPENWISSPYGGLLQSHVGWSRVTGDATAAFSAHTRLYVPARPGVTGGPSFQAAPHGPPPAALGIEVSRWALSALNARELRARLLAHPSTAQTLGARPPVQHVARPSPRPVATPQPPRRFAGDARGSGQGRR